MLVQDKWLELVFMMETKIVVCRSEVVKRRMGFLGCLGVDVIGRKGGWPYFGGIVMLWISSIFHKITFLLGSGMNVAKPDGFLLIFMENQKLIGDKELGVYSGTLLPNNFVHG